MQAELEEALNHQSGGRLSETDVVTILARLPEEDHLELYDWQLIKSAVTRRIDRRNASPDNPWNQWFWYVTGFALRSIILLSQEKPRERMSRQQIDCRRIDWINAVADEFSAGSIGEVISRNHPKLRKKAQDALRLLLQEAEGLRAATVARKITSILRCYQPGVCKIKIHQAGGQFSAHAWQQTG